MIKINDVTKIYTVGDKEYKAVSNINLELKEGLFYSILGPSGSGKSTLLRMIGGLDKPTNGNIIIDDIDIYSLNDKALAEFRNKKIGFVFQSFYLENSFTAIENIEVPMLISGMNKKDRKERALKLLTLLNIDDLAYKKIKELSGGECQRVSIARALANNPQLIIADEPTGALDSENAKIVLEELKRISSIGKTVILVTHDEANAEKYSDFIYRISDGRI